MKEKFSVKFETKNAANERRLQEALTRTPHERFLFFLNMIEDMKFFESLDQNNESTKNNFVIE